MGRGFRDKVDLVIGGGSAGAVTDFFLLVLSKFYALAILFWSTLYSVGFLRSARSEARVISVGNITVGGTGKTPMTIHIATHLALGGKKVAVLSRGYKGEATSMLLVSNGKDVLATAKEAGDEPFLMARKLLDPGAGKGERGVAVVVGPDRAASARFATEKLGAEVVILDDGFQHLKLARDLDIVLVDTIRGLGSGHQLPRGPLREPLSALRRADLVMVKSGGDKRVPLGGFVKKGSFCYRPGGLYSVAGSARLEVTELTGKRVLAVAGIASPASFEATLRECGAIVADTLYFEDHHSYLKDDIDEVMKRSSGGGIDLMVTTEKDGVKIAEIAGEVAGLYALSIDVVIEDEEAFFATIDKVVGL